MTFLLLAFYAAGVTACAGLVVACRRGRGGPPGPLQDVYEAAFLGGGPGRVADTALAAMHVDGRLAIGGPGVVAVDRAVAHDPVERAVLDTHAGAPHGALHTLRLGVMTHPAVQEIGDGLAARGLVVVPARRRTLRRRCLSLALAAFLMLPVSVVVTVVQFSDPEGAMVPFVVLVLPLFFGCFVTALVCGTTYTRQVSAAGLVALAACRRAHGHGGGTAHAVALGGIRALSDRDLWERLRNAARLQGPAAGSSRPSPSPYARHSSDTTAAAAVVLWCAGAAPGGGDGWDSGSGGSGCGSGGSSCGSSSSSCGSSSSSCGSSSSSSCGSSSSSCGSSSSSSCGSSG
ncbi:TIGR04222 domain-containing membrane protein [Streptomyces omiyaensis]|uniref:TIGR04222 domain-containing membrane protein n=1 Tax=Streptomyces omiyaensis TaxID=68247 RepID=UPI0036FF638B